MDRREFLKDVSSELRESKQAPTASLNRSRRSTRRLALPSIALSQLIAIRTKPLQYAFA
jgi:hypothetical protein